MTAVELGLFEALAKGPQNAEALTRQLGLNGRGAHDFFDALVALKLLDRDADGFYANAPDCSVYLDPDRPAYIGDLLEYLNARMYRTWDLLTPAASQGRTMRARSSRASRASTRTGQLLIFFSRE